MFHLTTNYLVEKDRCGTLTFPNLPPQQPHRYLPTKGDSLEALRKSLLTSDCRTSCCSLSLPWLLLENCESSPLGQAAAGCPVISPQTELGRGERRPGLSHTPIAFLEHQMQSLLPKPVSPPRTLSGLSEQFSWAPPQLQVPVYSVLSTSNFSFLSTCPAH